MTKKRNGHTLEGDLALVRAALIHLDPNWGYRRWFRIGAAIHTVTHGSKEGLALFDSWSSQSKTRYAGTEAVAKQWANFKRGKGLPIGIGTLLWLVEQTGISCDAVRREAAAMGRGGDER
jgi:hypothetical protein